MIRITALLCFGYFACLSFAIRFHPRDLNAPLANCYDYIIVGGGISGLVVANRLTEDPNITVLVLEAVDLDNYEDIILNPMENGQGLGSKYDWNLWTVPRIHLDGAARPYDVGRGVGGGSLINGMCWTRGGRATYDAWVELGSPGWGWEDLLPYFKKSENYTNNVDEEHRRTNRIQPDPSVHGTDGYVHVSYPRYFYNQSQLFLEGLEELGIPILTDPNNGTTTGSMLIPDSLSPDNQTRSSARLGYFDGFVDSRPNFHVATGQHVTRLLTKQKNTIFPRDYPAGLWISGVEFISDGNMIFRNVTCRREVILAAGAVHTPQILELSGIGSPHILRRFGIPAVLDLPGVGNNFQDHPYVGVVYYYSNASYFHINKQYYDSQLYSDLAQQYYVNKTGPWTSGAINTVAFPSLRSFSANWTNMVADADSQFVTQHLLPDLDATIISGYEAQKRVLVGLLRRSDVSAYEILNNNFGLMSVAIMHPFSRGSVHIQSINSFVQPLIDPRYCSNPIDCQILVDGLLFNNKIVNTESMQLLQPVPYYPFFQDATASTLMPAINSGLRTEFHGSGTTSMMPLEKGGVVDTRLRVYGTKNLRIVDAGIMPLIPDSHLQAPVYAVAEKAADIIKNDNAGIDPRGCGPSSEFAAPGPVLKKPFLSVTPTASVSPITSSSSSSSLAASSSSLALTNSSSSMEVQVFPSLLTSSNDTITESEPAPLTDPTTSSQSESSSTLQTTSALKTAQSGTKFQLPSNALAFLDGQLGANFTKNGSLTASILTSPPVKPSNFAQVMNLTEWSMMSFARKPIPKTSRRSFAAGAAPAEKAAKTNVIAAVASLFLGPGTLLSNISKGVEIVSPTSTREAARFRLDVFPPANITSDADHLSLPTSITAVKKAVGFFKLSHNVRVINTAAKATGVSTTSVGPKESGISLVG